MNINLEFPKGRMVITDARMGSLMGIVTWNSAEGVGVELANGGKAFFDANGTLGDLFPVCRACGERPCSYDSEPPDDGFFSYCDNRECMKTRTTQAIAERKAAASPARYQGFVNSDSGYLGIFDTVAKAILNGERYSYPQDLANRLKELNATEEDK